MSQVRIATLSIAVVIGILATELSARAEIPFWESPFARYALLETTWGRRLTEMLVDVSASDLAEPGRADAALKELALMKDVELRAQIEEKLTLARSRVRDLVGSDDLNAIIDQSSPFVRTQLLQMAVDDEIASQICSLDLVKPFPEVLSKPNPFFRLSYLKLGERELQTRALTVLSKSPRVSNDLAAAAREKLRFYEPVHGGADLDLSLALMNEEDRTQAALEYAVTTFHHADFDRQFLEGLITQLAGSPLSGEHTIEALLPIARGAKVSSTVNPRSANDAIIKISQRLDTSFPFRAQARASHPRVDPMDILLHEPIRSVKPLGGGVNTTLLVTFEDGNQGVFKPLAGEANYGSPSFKAPNFILYTREVNAYDLVENWLGDTAARNSGESAIEVPVTAEAILTHQGRAYGVGSLQFFKKGYTPLGDLMGSNPERWRELSSSLDWQKAEARIRTVDFLLGNHDRFPNRLHMHGNMGNILVSPSGERLSVALIDNGVGRWPDNAGFDVSHAPVRAHIPDDLKAAVTGFDEVGFRQSYADRMSQNGIDDFVARVRALQQRIAYGP